MDKNLKISIIIPVYKVSLYIERCLLSVLNQSYDNLEIIIVDDASPDDSMEKAAKMLAQFPTSHEIKIITHETNKGISVTRNTGLKIATGEFVYFLDSDDDIPENSIKTLVGYLKLSSDIEVVIGNIDIIPKENKQTTSIRLALKDKTILGKNEFINSFLRQQWYDTPWNKLIKRDILVDKKLYFLEGIVHEDTLWCFYLAYQSNKAAICEQITYHYYINKNSITNKKSEKNFNSLLIVLEKILSFIPATDYQERKNLLCIYLTNLKIFFLKSLILSSCDISYVKNMKIKINSALDHPLFKGWHKPIVLSIKENLLNTLINFNIKK